MLVFSDAKERLSASFRERQTSRGAERSESVAPRFTEDILRLAV